MFDFDITNPFVQGMIQEEIDNNQSEYYCPSCGLRLVFDPNDNTYKCKNDVCDYRFKPLIRKR